jgi:hypothetical protein
VSTLNDHPRTPGRHPWVIIGTAASELISPDQRPMARRPLKHRHHCRAQPIGCAASATPPVACCIAADAAANARHDIVVQNTRHEVGSARGNALCGLHACDTYKSYGRGNKIQESWLEPQSVRRAQASRRRSVRREEKRRNMHLFKSVTAPCL